MADRAEPEILQGPADSLKVAVPPDATLSTSEISAPMFDVHAPHEAVRSWKDFFVHLATIVVGLLIAIGLEQTVEYFHHRHQVAEARAALELELRMNVNRFEAETQSFRQFVPVLQRNLAVFQHLHEHPGAPRAQWPGDVEWESVGFTYRNTAWRAAEQSGVLEHMPQVEVRHYAAISRRLEVLSDLSTQREFAVGRAAMYTIAQPDVSLLSPAMVDEEISLTSSALLAYTRVAIVQQYTSQTLHEFASAPTLAEIQSVTHRASSPEAERKIETLQKKVFDFDKQYVDRDESE